MNYPEIQYPTISLFTKILWPDHQYNGGTGLCKLGDSELFERVAESVRLFGDSRIWTKDNELHSSMRDLSKFWSFHESRI